MKKDKVAYIYVILFVILADTYIIVDWIRSVIVLNVLLSIWGIAAKKLKFTKETRKILIVTYVFVVCIFVIDLIHQNDLAQHAWSALSSLFVPLVFIYFYSLKNSIYYILLFFKLFLIYNGVFSLFQILGTHITAGMLLSHFPLLGVTVEKFVGISTQGLRVTGAYSSNITLSCMLGVAAILFYFIWRNYKKNLKWYFFATLLIMLVSQNRSVLFSVLPIIACIEIFYRRKISFKVVFSSIFVVSFFFIAFSLLKPVLEKSYPRLFLSVEDDNTIVHRVQANVYGVVGTFYKSPWIGLPQEQSIIAMNEGYKRIGLFVGNYYIDEVTQHNQIGYYYRYYGFIGLFLFLYLYYLFFRFSIVNNRVFFVRQLLVSVLLFYLSYTLFHNNKFIQDYYIWILLAINFNKNIYANRIFIK